MLARLNKEPRLADVGQLGQISPMTNAQCKRGFGVVETVVRDEVAHARKPAITNNRSCIGEYNDFMDKFYVVVVVVIVVVGFVIVSQRTVVAIVLLFAKSGAMLCSIVLLIILITQVLVSTKVVAV